MGKFQPGQSGNPAGRPKGATSYRARAERVLNSRCSEKVMAELVEKVIADARDGRQWALKLLFERWLPVLRRDEVTMHHTEPVAVEELESALDRLAESYAGPASDSDPEIH